MPMPDTQPLCKADPQAHAHRRRLREEKQDRGVEGCGSIRKKQKGETFATSSRIYTKRTTHKVKKECGIPNVPNAAIDLFL